MKNLFITLFIGLLFFSCSSNQKRQEAIEKYNEALNYYSYSILNLSYSDSTLKKTIEILDEAIEIDPEYAFPYCKKASILTEMAQTDEGLTVLEAGFKKVGENDINLLIQKVILYEKQGQTDLAMPVYDKLIAAYDKILKKDPESFYALSNKAVLIGLTNNLEMGLKKLEEIPTDKLAPNDTIQLKFLKRTLKESSRDEIIKKMDL
ncbi:hypothetical protein LJB92_02205 [Bacteroidales bacterium OttesenSCG-928-M06]|nr:hypothetical protein [Bacteroidales bacterium OttesenSCG-928-M06]